MQKISLGIAGLSRPAVFVGVHVYILYIEIGFKVVYCRHFSDWAAGWAIEQWRFDSRKGQDVILLLSVDTFPGAHSISYLVGSGTSFPRSKAAQW